MHIVQIVTELCPIARVGGLADVVYGLSKELSRQGHRVEIILPKYDCMHDGELKNLKAEYRDVWSFEGTERYNNTVWSADLDGLKLLLIEPHHPQCYFGRGVIYGCPDDIDRFAYFSRTALEFLFKAGNQPDVIHVHDWPTALVPVLLKEMYRPLGYQAGGSVLTIHNMQHQGHCQPFNLSRIGLHGDIYLTPDRLQDPYAPHLLNLLKGGIVYADQITTVSPNYEKEIQTPEGGFGLQGVLIQHREKLKGILNGIDEDFWNPGKDPHLLHRYATHGIEKDKISQVLESKKENKRFLRDLFKLKHSDAPLVASVTRLVHQKSPELIKYSFHRTLEKGGQFILLGTTNVPSFQDEFEKFQQEFRNNANGIVLLDKDEALAHQIFAAADLFIIPSLFEPCGLTQLIALRYGTVPLARFTGGLADTVFDIDTSSRPLEERNGFTFDFPDKKGVDWALSRALDCFQHDPKKWQTLVLHGIEQDFSWKHSTRDYLSIYRSLGKAAPKNQQNQLLVN